MNLLDSVRPRLTLAAVVAEAVVEVVVAAVEEQLQVEEPQEQVSPQQQVLVLLSEALLQVP